MKIRFFILAMLVATASWAQQADFRPQTVILKVKPAYRVLCTDQSIDVPALKDAFAQLQPERVWKKFPTIPAPDASRLAPGFSQNPEDISLIYELNYHSSVPVPKAVEALKRTGVFVFAEPAYIAHPISTPSDPLLDKQWHLDLIHALEAWEIDSGSSDIVVGVTDTGIDWDHPDLVDAIHYNEADPIDGEDNDGNGYVDDYRGWNFYNNNNDPDELSWSHGTHVSGLACASTNNGIGVAGTGYLTKVLPVKCGDKLELTHGYEGIIYAYERGAQIINCSWGSTSITEFGHSIVRFVANEGVLLVGGAGNNNNDYDFYPASFKEVLSVAASDSLNGKAIFSSYNYNVDITAPGQVVLSTKNGAGVYETESGTSMSAPIVAGAAALVIHRFPQLTPQQVMAQLRETTDDIYGYENNDMYQDQLGTGLLNMERALQDLVPVSIRIDSHYVTDNEDEIFALGEQVDLSIELVNLMGATGPVTVKLRSLDESVTITDSVRTFAAMPAGVRTNNFAAPFNFTVDSFVSYNQEITMRLDITSGNYASKQFIQVLVNPDFVNVAVNDISSSVSSHGLLGYANNQRSHGLGFELKDHGNLLYESGLLIGHQSRRGKHVLDRVRGEQHSDRDFSPERFILREEPEAEEAFFAFGTFTDTSANADEIGVRVSQRIKAYDEDGHRNYFIAEYTLTNVSGEDLSDVYVGIYADWDIINASENRGETAYGKRFGYLYSSSDQATTAGIQVLSLDKPFYSYMIDNANGGSGGVNQSQGGFSSDEKYTALTTNRWTEGLNEQGTDVSHVVSSGGYAIRNGDSITVAFALIGASSIDGALRAADAAYEKYNGFGPGENIYSEFQTPVLSPNPTSDGVLKLDFDLKTESRLFFYLYDAHGNLVANLGEQYFYTGKNIRPITLPDVPTGMYFLHIHSEHFVKTLPIVYDRQD